MLSMMRNFGLIMLAFMLAPAGVLHAQSLAIEAFRSFGGGRTDRTILGSSHQTIKRRRHLVGSWHNRGQLHGGDDHLNWALYRARRYSAAKSGEDYCQEHCQREDIGIRVRPPACSRTNDRLGLAQSYPRWKVHNYHRGFGI